MKHWLRILIAMGIGFGIAMLVMTVMIYFGYTNAYAGGGDSCTVRLVGLQIYKLTLIGDKYSGQSVGTNMGAVCVICMAAVLAVEELIIHRKKRK